jgi:hypothetical protein
VGRTWFETGGPEKRVFQSTIRPPAQIRLWRLERAVDVLALISDVEAGPFHGADGVALIPA